jgi:hypothetical protein
MTKTKARERAKAKAAQKASKREANADQPRQIRPGHFDPGSGSIKSPKSIVNDRSFAAGRRGAARSK